MHINRITVVNMDYFLIYIEELDALAYLMITFHKMF